jgi:hypothetical protein
MMGTVFGFPCEKSMPAGVQGASIREFREILAKVDRPTIGKRRPVPRHTAYSR